MTSHNWEPPHPAPRVAGEPQHDERDYERMRKCVLEAFADRTRFDKHFPSDDLDPERLNDALFLLIQSIDKTQGSSLPTSGQLRALRIITEMVERKIDEATERAIWRPLENVLLDDGDDWPL